MDFGPPKPWKSTKTHCIYQLKWKIACFVFFCLLLIWDLISTSCWELFGIIFLICSASFCFRLKVFVRGVGGKMSPKWLQIVPGDAPFFALLAHGLPAGSPWLVLVPTWLHFGGLRHPVVSILVAFGTLSAPFWWPQAPFKLHFGRLGHLLSSIVRSFG